MIALREIPQLNAIQLLVHMFRHANPTNYTDNTVGTITNHESVTVTAPQDPLALDYGDNSNTPNAPVNLGGAQSGGSPAGSTAPSKGTNWFTIPGTNWCGPGGAGTPTTRVDAACKAHDSCYDSVGVSWKNNVGQATTTPQQRAQINACDAALSNAIRNISWPTSAETGQATIVSTWFNLPSGYSLNPGLPNIPLLPQLPFPAF